MISKQSMRGCARLGAICGFALAMLSTPFAHAAPVAQGSAFQVNTVAITFPNLVGAVRVAMAADGRFAIAWPAMEGSDAGFNIYVRLFASDGTPLGPEFVANSVPATADGADKRLPAIAMDANGNFVVGWSDGVAAVSGYNYRARVFSADGTPQGDDFCVDANCPTGNAAGLAAQEAIALAMDNAGNWAAAWNENPGPVGINGLGTIKMRRFNADGSAKDAAPVTVSSAKGDGLAPVLAMGRNSGNFTVSWWNGTTSRSTAFSQKTAQSVQVQRYNADGSTAGAAVAAVSCSGTVYSHWIFGCTTSTPLLTSDDADNLTIHWLSSSQKKITAYAERLAPGSSTLGSKITLMSKTQDNSTIPSAAGEDGSGAFVTLWQSGGSPVMVGQAVAANNSLNGGPVTFTPTSIYSNFGGFALNATDSAVAVWAQTAGGVLTINAQRYLLQ